MITLDPIDAYTRWAPTYDPAAHNYLMVLEERAVLDLLPDVRGAVVLDLACGTGRYLGHLLARGVGRAVGLDVTPAMLARARAVSAALVRADLARLPFPRGAFDLVVCGLAIGHVGDLGGAIAEIGRVLRPGGIAVYSDLHPAGTRAGWVRTFRGTDGRQYAVTHHIHDREAHESACRAAGLILEDTREPVIDIDHVCRGWPTVLVIRARKAA